MKRHLPYFFLPLALYWVFLAVMSIHYGYTGSFIELNSRHSPFLDQPMFLLTWLGDSLLVTSLLVLVFRKDPAFCINLIITVVFTGLFVQLLKNFVFPGWDRPLGLLGDQQVHIVNGVRLSYHAFPSGHSTTVGAVFTLLAFRLGGSRFWQVAMAMAIMLVSYTRIYTGAHFPADVLAGSMLGASSAWLFQWLAMPGLVQWKEKAGDMQQKRLSFSLGAAALTGLCAFILGLVYLQ